MKSKLAQFEIKKEQLRTINGGDSGVTKHLARKTMD
jgi:hypothetical protein